ncbi:MAG: hypothetical protein LC660_11210 [Desulfobacteraceae bacterium]|nr:hypothetical protein [Desulfobacteraceae bacterium]
MKVLDSGFFDNPDLNRPGKWLFPINLVRQWVEAGTENYPRAAQLPPYHGLVLIAGSNDLLLEKRGYDLSMTGKMVYPPS